MEHKKIPETLIEFKKWRFILLHSVSETQNNIELCSFTLLNDRTNENRVQIDKEPLIARKKSISKKIWEYWKSSQV